MRNYGLLVRMNVLYGIYVHFVNYVHFETRVSISTSSNIHTVEMQQKRLYIPGRDPYDGFKSKMSNYCYNVHLL